MYRRAYIKSLSIHSRAETQPEMDPELDAQWKRIQEKTFTRWVNEQLKVQKVAVKNLAEDFKDGVLLIVLLEVLSHKSIGKYNKKPRMLAQKIENLEKVLSFITKQEGIRLVNIGENTTAIKSIL